jgi:SH3 domain-containing YSC84-like protein 1
VRRLALVSVLSCRFAVDAAETPGDRLASAAEILREALQTPGGSIQRGLVRNASCVIVVPGLTDTAAPAGGKSGEGFAVCRHRERWSAPAAVRIEGSSLGFQLGAGRADLVMLVMDDRGMSHLMRGRLTLGGEMTVAAGPVGPGAVAGGARILSWYRESGKLAGVAIHGVTVSPDTETNRQLYGSRMAPKDILTAGCPSPPSAANLEAQLDGITRRDATDRTADPRNVKRR